MASPTPHSTLMLIIGQSVFVLILSEVAGFNDQIGRVIFTFVIGLWLVYLINSGPALFRDLNLKIGLP